MKILCAWCERIIRISCDHCGSPLFHTKVLGASLPFTERDEMTCINGLTPINYSAEAIERMQISHGICEDCRWKLRRQIEREINQPPEKRGPTSPERSAETHEGDAPKKIDGGL